MLNLGMEHLGQKLQNLALQELDQQVQVLKQLHFLFQDITELLPLQMLKNGMVQLGQKLLMLTQEEIVWQEGVLFPMHYLLEVL
jgi:hypothetical protein